MRVPFLILCLAVAYGACRIHGEENVDLAEELENYNRDFNEDYNNDHKLNHANIPFEKSLSRHRRASLLSSLIPSINNLTSFVTDALSGKDVCKVEKLSPDLITKPVTSLIQIPKTIICKVLQAIGAPGHAIVQKLFEVFSDMFRNAILPRLHSTLNTLGGIRFLPPQIKAMIDGFNLVYGLLQMTGYVPK